MDAVKKISLIAAAIGALAIQSPAMAADGAGVLNFSGNIIQAGCKFNGADTFTMATDFGTVAANAFATVGARARLDKPITIQLTNCPGNPTGTTASTINGTKVALGFRRPVNVSTTGLANNVAPLDGTSTAKGVGVGLWNTNGTAIALDSETDFPYDMSDPNNLKVTINLVADYVSTMASVSPGTANTVITVSARYD